MKGTYETMGVYETWRNRLHSAPEDSTSKLTPLHKMNATLYDGLIADPWFGNEPHPQMPPFTANNERVARVIAFVREPSDLAAPLEEHYRDTMFMKNLHALSWNHQHSVIFMYVDVKKDEDNIALSLGFDSVHPDFFPAMVLVQGNSVYVANKKVTETYASMSFFIEGGYKC